VVPKAQLIQRLSVVLIKGEKGHLIEIRQASRQRSNNASLSSSFWGILAFSFFFWAQLIALECVAIQLPKLLIREALIMRELNNFFFLNEN
jgi:hypothetical protein